MAQVDKAILDLVHLFPWDLSRGEQDKGHHGCVVTCVKRTRTRMVLRVERPHEGDSLPGLPDSIRCFFIKRYLHAGRWYRRLSWRFGLSKADREAEMHQQLAEQSVLVPKVLGTTADSKASYLVTHELPYLITLGEALKLAPRGARHTLWMLAGIYLKELWEQGVFHPDLLQEHLCMTTFVGLDPHDYDSRQSQKRREEYWSEQLTKLPSDPHSCVNLSLPNLYESQQLSSSDAAFSFCLIDVDGTQIHGTGRDVPMAQRYFNAMQQLRSLPSELGTPIERCLMLECAFGEDFLNHPEDIWKQIESLARREKESTSIHLTRGQARDHGQRRRKLASLEMYLRKYVYA